MEFVHMYICVCIMLAVANGVLYSRSLAGRYRRRVYITSTYTLALMMWPAVFDCLVGFKLARRLPLVNVGLIWPFLFLTLNIAQARNSRDRKLHPRGSLQMDVGSISGFSFAIGSLISSQMGKHAGIVTSPIFTFAFLLCLGFVLPTPDIPEDFNLTFVIEAMQQSFLHFAIALLISGLAINLSFTMNASREREAVLSKVMQTPVHELIK